jgi:phytoene dehydrogenase-like protein
LAKYFLSLGGKIITGQEVKDIDELPSSKFVFFDLSPRQLLKIAGKKFPESYRKQLKKYRYGPGVYKIDYALDGPIPWKAADCARSATVHVGGTLEEIVEAEEQVWQGEHPRKPFVLLAQQTTIDPSRAPAGKHTAWAYCHVPNGSTFDMKERIESQIERFAPGFCDRILATTITTPNELEEYNANYIGGDINSGVQDLGQLFTRPVARLVPYSTPAKGIYICSSSTPPGGGVHGMSGYHAAKAALKTMKSP